MIPILIPQSPIPLKYMEPLQPPDDIDTVLRDPDNHFLQWVEPWPGINRDGSHRDVAMVHIASATDAIALQRNFSPTIIADPPRELLLDFISVHWARFVPAPSLCPPTTEQEPPNQTTP